MNTKESFLTNQHSHDKIGHLLGTILKRKAITAAVTLGYWVTLLLWSLFR